MDDLGRMLRMEEKSDMRYIMEICQNSNANFLAVCMAFKFSYSHGFCNIPPKGGVSVELWVCFRASLYTAEQVAPFLRHSTVQDCS